jgi:carbon monoxide dehydrogenase subunit G
MSGHFRFASSHRLAAPRDAVFDILADAERWPEWWPQVRTIIRYDDTHGRAEIRSALPLTLRVELTSERSDRESGVLRAVLGGDLVGWAQFELHSDGPTRTRLDYAQEVDLHVLGRLGRAASYPFARPLLVANHALMMRSGMRGLARAAAR